MKMKRYKMAALAALLMGMSVNTANAATITLWESAFLNNGSLTAVNDSTFDYGTGLGVITKSFAGAGNYDFRAFFDHEIDQDLNTYFNEYGSAVGVPSAIQSWEIDEPKGFFGDIKDNLYDGDLDNSNSIHGFFIFDDVSMALGWKFSLTATQTALITLNISESRPSSGFYLSQTDPDSQASIFLASSFDLKDRDPNHVPEPATMLLMGTGLAALFGVARRKTKSA